MGLGQLFLHSSSFSTSIDSQLRALLLVRCPSHARTADPKDYVITQRT